MVYNPYIVIPLATFAVAQVAKFALAAFRGRLDFRLLVASGGMPSVHAAIVCSLATTALLLSGAGSAVFGVTAVLAAIVIYDSLNVRRAVGEQGEALNLVIESLERSRVRGEKPWTPVRRVLGHEPLEVFIGAVLGIVLAGILNYERLGSIGDFLQASPALPETVVYFVVAAVLIVGSAITRVIIGRRGSKTLSKLGRQILTFGQTIGWLLLLGAVLIYERASYFGWRMWVLAVITVGVVWVVVLVSRWRKRLPEALKAESEAARKNKWFTWGRRKRRS